MYLKTGSCFGSFDHSEIKTGVIMTLLVLDLFLDWWWSLVLLHFSSK